MLRWAIAALVWGGCTAQLWIAIASAPPGARRSTLVHFFSFFTIWTNVLVGLTVTFAGRFGTNWRSAIADYIAVVAIVFALVLNGDRPLEGVEVYLDSIFHQIVPLLYLLWWFFFGQRRLLVWRDLWAWPAYPAAYLLYSLLRGEVVAWFPYPFLNAAHLGYRRVLWNSAGVTAVCVLIGIAILGLNHLRLAKHA